MSIPLTQLAEHIVVRPSPRATGRAILCVSRRSCDVATRPECTLPLQRSATTPDFRPQEMTALIDARILSHVHSRRKCRRRCFSGTSDVHEAPTPDSGLFTVAFRLLPLTFSSTSFPKASGTILRPTLIALCSQTNFDQGSEWRWEHPIAQSTVHLEKDLAPSSVMNDSKFRGVGLTRQACERDWEYKPR